MTLLVPGLLGPIRGVSAAMLDLPDTPGLTRLLGATIETGPGGYEDAVRGCFGLAHDAPSAQAAAGFLAAHGRAPDSDCLCASPVHLRVETDYLLLYDDQLLHLEDAEASALAADFNRIYGDDGLQMEVVSPARWYLTGFATDGVSTTPLRAVRCRAVGPFMPAGRRGGRLRALLNEIQMLFHDHPVNRVRAERGRPTVSGLWLWGEGAMPKTVAAPWARVWADDPWVRGLARLGGAPDAVVPRGFAAAASGGPALVVLEGADTAAAYADTAAAYADAAGWADALASAEREWFAPAWQALRAGTLEAVEIVPGDGRRFVARRRWWPRLRRSLPLTHYLEKE